MNLFSIVTTELREAIAGAARGIRRHRKLLPVGLALSSLVVGLLLAICDFGVPDVPEMDAASERCLKERRFAEAAIWARRSLREQPDATRSRMTLIQSQIALGAWESLAEHLNRLAPMDRAVYGSAHLLRARLIWSSRPADPAAREAVARCLKLAWEAGFPDTGDAADRISAHALGAELAASLGDWRQVLSEVAEIPAPDCDLQALKAFACWNLDMKVEAAAAADRALQCVESWRNADDDSIRTRKVSAQALAWLSKGKPESAIRAVSGSRLDLGQPRERLLLTELCKTIAGACRSKRQKDPRLWTEAMATALAASPDNLELTMMLLEGVADWKSLPGFIERLNNRFSTGELGAIRDLILGMGALAESKTDLASACFEKAFARLPGNPVIGNNHAALLGTRPVAPDTGKARAIMADIVKRYPAQSTFLDTLGRVELRAGNNPEAIRWFEAALRLQSSAGTHLAAAEAYARLGNADKAMEHRRSAGIRN